MAGNRQQTDFRSGMVRVIVAVIVVFTVALGIAVAVYLGYDTAAGHYRFCYDFISALGVFLRDLKVVVAVFVQILFFMTPILYPIEKLSKLPPWLHSILSLNPLLYIFESARATLVYGQMPDFRALAIITVLGIVLLQL